ncbi:MAG: MBL fold metallo-hydrolase [Chloroflexi bacterium]|nr:MBL fold metallo-hydrolase [Chloroflexota bacterium]
MSQAILLGVAQDGGVPHAGCQCLTCIRARKEPDERRLVVSLALVDDHRAWLIDATPDFPTQLQALLDASLALSGILLTHAHIGHYAGLIHLGREVMNARRLPVYASPRMAAFLRNNAPWSGLVEERNIDLVEITPRVEFALTPALRVTPVPIPHRGEYSDTMAYFVRGAKRRLFYCPDIDGWDEFDLAGMVSRADVALLDGAFFDATELPGRDIRDIPHPLVPDTVSRLGHLTADVRFIHLNHTNPLLHPGPQLDWLHQQGFDIGRFGERWEL